MKRLIPSMKMVQQNLLKNLTSYAKGWNPKKLIMMIQKKDDILSLPEKSLYVFYHEVTGFLASRGNGKHSNKRIFHIRIRDQDVGRKFRIRISQ